MKILAKRTDYLSPNGFSFSVGIGVVSAALFTWLRGGFRDKPSVLVVFWAFGFSVSALFCWLLRRKTLLSLEGIFARIPHVKALRASLAFAITASFVFWAGPLIQSGGYAGWLYGIVFCLFGPLVVSLLAKRHPILFGALAATSIILSSVLATARFDWAHSHHPQETFWQLLWRGWWPDLAIPWLFALGLSLLSSVPIYAHRPKQQAA